MRDKKKQEKGAQGKQKVSWEAEDRKEKEGEKRKRSRNNTVRTILTGNSSSTTAESRPSAGDPSQSIPVN